MAIGLRPLYCPWSRWYPPYGATFALRLPALHGTSDGATMFASGGAGTTPRTVFDNSFVLGATGFYHRGGASWSELALTLRSAPPR
jgi:hypothetical protein